MWVIGWLHDGDSSDPVDVQYENAFKQGMRDLGYVEGRNYRLEKRFSTHDPGSAQASAAELAALKVDVIVALTTLAAIATHKVTREIPIVTDAGDPVGFGLAQSLARPGGNVTGMTSLSAELYSKRVDLLRQLVPGLQRVGFLYNPENPADRTGLKQFESACSKIALRSIPAPARNAGELTSAFQVFGRASAQGLVVTSRSMLELRQKLIEQAAASRLPTVYSRSAFADAGGLIAFGPDYPYLYRHCASYVDRILKGAKPGDLPIEQPDRYELAINLKTAKALGIKVPDAMLLRADRVIQVD